MRTGKGIRFIACIASLLVCASCAAPQTPQATVSGAPVSGAAANTVLEGRYIREVFPELDVATDIEYGSAVGESGETETLLLDVYQPKGDMAERRPAVIFVHGGGFTSGDKASGIEKMLAERLAKKGYVTLSINYRLSKNPGGNWVRTFRETSADAYTAFEWLVAHADEYRVDKDHIAFGGHSAGSNIVVELCYGDWSGRKLDKKGIFAVIAMAGPESMTGSPAADDPFCLIIHGKLDELMPYSLSERFNEELTAAGTPHLFHPLPACPHNFGAAIGEVDDVVTSALYKSLTGRESGITVRSFERESLQMVADRTNQNRTVEAPVLSITIDGDLGEWPDEGFMAFDGLKDAGSALPDQADLQASGMLAWDKEHPGCLCVAVKVKDDVFQERDNESFWLNDSVELLLDLSDSVTLRPCVQWSVNINGRDVNGSDGSAASCEARTIIKGGAATFEFRVDIGRMLPEFKGFSPEGKTLGVSLAYNDCEGGKREHQVGITAGDTWTPGNFANLIMGKNK